MEPLAAGADVVAVAWPPKSWLGALAAPSGTPRSATLQLEVRCKAWGFFVGDDSKDEVPEFTGSVEFDCCRLLSSVLLICGVSDEDRRPGNQNNRLVTFLFQAIGCLSADLNGSAYILQSPGWVERKKQGSRKMRKFKIF